MSIQLRDVLDYFRTTVPYFGRRDPLDDFLLFWTNKREGDRERLRSTQYGGQVESCSVT